MIDALVKQAFALFVHNIEWHGQYHKAGKITSEPKPLTSPILREHFEGKTVLGVYPIRSKDQTCRWIAWDIDAHNGETGTWEKALSVASQARDMGLNPVIEDSDGAGSFHVWAFLYPMASASEAYKIAHSIEGVEAYPKQAENSSEHPGNWLRLPGKHHTKDHWSRFWNPEKNGGDWEGLEYLLAVKSTSISPALTPPAVTPAASSRLPSSPAKPGGGSLLPDFEDTVSALNAIPNDEESWKTAGEESRYRFWFKILGAMALYGTDEAYQYAKVWSESDPSGKYSDDEYFDVKWKELVERKTKSRVTGRTIINLAAKHFGWKAPNPLAHLISGEKAAPQTNYATTPEELHEKREKRLAKMNEKYAVVYMGKGCFYLWPNWNPLRKCTEYHFWNERNFRQGLADQYPVQKDLTISPKTFRPGFESAADFWLNNPRRRVLHGTCFEPGKEVDGMFNLWRGWAVKPQEGDCSLWLAHLLEVICSGNTEYFSYLLAWFADIIQNPCNKPGSSVVLRGEQGSGKNMLIEYFADILGPHYQYAMQRDQITGKFNAHLEECLLLFADEAGTGSVHSKGFENALKSLITNDVLRIERKGVDSYSVPNRTHIIMASNDNWVVPVGMDDRRFFVLDVSAARANDREYFAPILQERSNGGPAALLDYLLQLDISQIDLRKIPKTQALLDQKIASLGPVESFWYSRLQDGVILQKDEKWESFFVKSYLFEFFLERNSTARDSSWESQFWTTMRRICPLRDSRTTIDGKRKRGFDVVPLNAAREHFEKSMKMKMIWDEDPSIEVINVQNWDMEM